MLAQDTQAVCNQAPLAPRAAPPKRRWLGTSWLSRPWLSTLVVALIIAVAGSAAAAGKRQDKKKLADGEDLYYSGNYEEALFMLEELAQQDKVDKKLRVRALKFIAFCYFLLDAKEQAKEAWLRIQELEPGFKLDQVDESPEFVSFFNVIEAPAAGAEGGAKTADGGEGGGTEGGGEGGTGEGGTGEGAASGEGGSGASGTEGAEVINAKTGESGGGGEKDGVSKKIPPPEEDLDERGCGIVLCLIPGGVGQYANGQIVKGIIFTTLEAALLGLNIGFYYWNESEIVGRGSNGQPIYRDPQAAVDRYWAQIGFFIGAVGTALLGIVDAFLFY